MSTQVTEPAGAVIAPTNDSTTPSGAPRDRDEVAIRAYEIYCGRGREHGHDLDDWIEAERQLREELPRTLAVAYSATGVIAWSRQGGTLRNTTASSAALSGPSGPLKYLRLAIVTIRPWPRG
jgi:hypothetical protein